MSKFFMMATIEVDGVKLDASAVRYYTPAEPDVGIFSDEIEWSWALPADLADFADERADAIEASLEAEYQARQADDGEPRDRGFDGQAEANALTDYERSRGL